LEIKGKINVKYAARDTYFYDHKLIGQTIEHSLSIFESNISKNIYNDLISSEDHMIFEIPKHKMLFSEFIAVQLIRTKQYRESIKVYCKMIKDNIRDDVVFEDNDLEEHIQKMDSDESIKELHLSFFKSETIKDIAKMLFNKKWLILVNDTEIPFWTSNNPIAKFNPLNYSLIQI
jgi:Protein of unknown function (DUF4238)